MITLVLIGTTYIFIKKDPVSPLFSMVNKFSLVLQLPCLVLIIYCCLLKLTIFESPQIVIIPCASPHNWHADMVNGKENIEQTCWIICKFTIVYSVSNVSIL